MGNAGRSTTGGPKVPYYPRGGVIEAAKHLRRTLSRFISSNASVNDVEDAIGIWHATLTEARKRDENDR